jgi:hypothetical protein
VRGWTRFATMQVQYNLIYREEEREMIPLCRDQGLGVLAWSALARGFLAHMRYALADDQAFVITLATGGAKYLGFHLTDRWSFTPDPGRNLISRNLTQVTSNPDGTIIYVVRRTDPGLWSLRAIISGLIQSIPAASTPI